MPTMMAARGTPRRNPLVPKQTLARPKALPRPRSKVPCRAMRRPQARSPRSRNPLPHPRRPWWRLFRRQGQQERSQGAGLPFEGAADHHHREPVFLAHRENLAAGDAEFGGFRELTDLLLQTRADFADVGIRGIGQPIQHRELAGVTEGDVILAGQGSRRQLRGRTMLRPRDRGEEAQIGLQGVTGRERGQTLGAGLEQRGDIRQLREGRRGELADVDRLGDNLTF